VYGGRDKMCMEVQCRDKMCMEVETRCVGRCTSGSCTVRGQPVIGNAQAGILSDIGRCFVLTPDEVVSFDF